MGPILKLRYLVRYGRPWRRYFEAHAAMALCCLVDCDEVVSSVFLPAAFRAFSADRLFLSIADERNAGRGNAEVGQILLCACCATLAKRLIVFDGPSLIAIAFDLDFDLRVCLQPVCVRLQDFRQSLHLHSR